MPSNNFERLGVKQCCFVCRVEVWTDRGELVADGLPPSRVWTDCWLSRRQLGGGHAGRWDSASQHGQEGHFTHDATVCKMSVHSLCTITDGHIWRCSWFTLLPTSQQQNFNNRFPNFNWFSLEKSKAFFLCRAPHRLAETSRILLCQHPTNGTLIRWHQQTNTWCRWCTHLVVCLQEFSRCS